jgi:hypothetical protein
VLNPALATVTANPTDAFPPRVLDLALATAAVKSADAPPFFLFPLFPFPFSFLCSCFLLLSPPLHAQHDAEQSSTLSARPSLSVFNRLPTAGYTQGGKF